MQGKWHIALFLGALACSVLAGYCRVRARAFAGEADLEQQRSMSSSSSFVDTFSGEFVSSQLDQMDHRRSLIQSASRWNEGMLFSLVAVVLLTFAAYTVRSVESTFEEDSPIPPALTQPHRP